MESDLSVDCGCHIRLHQIVAGIGSFVSHPQPQPRQFSIFSVISCRILNSRSYLALRASIQRIA